MRFTIQLGFRNNNKMCTWTIFRIRIMNQELFCFNLLFGTRSLCALLTHVLNAFPTYYMIVQGFYQTVGNSPTKYGLSSMNHHIFVVCVCACG